MKKPIGVILLNEYIKRELTTDPILKNLYVVGEVTNLKINKFVYFDLKEDEDLISCVYFDNDINISEGDKIIVTGSINLYTKNSRYQIKVSKVENIGKGEEFIQLLLLKKKLQEEGFFDEKHKKKIPLLPINIGLITSEKSAAIIDFLSILEKRYPIANIFLYPTKVQGIQASTDIKKAIKKLDHLGLDLIVITRGGGSNEDLSVFNDEGIAREIFNANTPIISAVGHEIDITICDMVSDLRVSTPTKAAEYICNYFDDSLLQIDNYNLSNKKYLNDYMKNLELNMNYYHIQIQKYSPLNVLKDRETSIATLHLQNKSFIGNYLLKKELIIRQIKSDIEQSIKDIMEGNLLQIRDMDENYIDIQELQVGNSYYAQNDKVKYKIEILEKIDG